MNRNSVLNSNIPATEHNLSLNINDDKHSNEDVYSKNQAPKQEERLNQTATSNIIFHSNDKKLVDNSSTTHTVTFHSILPKIDSNDTKKEAIENNANEEITSNVNSSLKHSLNVNDIPQPLQEDDTLNTESVTTRKGNSHSSSICHNCKTDTTPLWRRDENGNTLCNACGLFLKLHGTPRPINLKSNVIKSRNRKSNNHNKNHTVNKIFKANSQANNPFQNNIHRSSSKQYMRESEIFSLRDSDPVKRFKTSLIRDQEFNKLEPSSLIKATKSIKPLLKPRPIRCERENYTNSRGFSYPSEFEEESGKANPLSIPSLLESNFLNHKSYLTGKKAATSDHYIKDNTINKHGSCSSSDSDTEFPKHLTLTHDSNISLSEYLSNEEDVIKLRTRIKELELVTDLYKDYIFRMNEKCQNLEALLRSTYNRN